MFAAPRRHVAPLLPTKGGNDILPFSPAFAAGLAIAIFVVDTFTPFDVAIAVLYVAVVLLSLNFASRRGLLLIAAGCVLLTVLGFFLSHGLDAPIGSVARFGVSLTAIAITAGLALKVRESIDVLRDSERRYRNIFLASGIAILEMDFTALGRALASGEVPPPRQALTMMRLRNANATAIKMFGTRDFETFARALPSFTPHEMEPTIAAMVGAIVAGERYYEAEMVMTTIDGRRIDVLTTLALPADRPDMDMALVTIMDVTAGAMPSAGWAKRAASSPTSTASPPWANSPPQSPTRSTSRSPPSSPMGRPACAGSPGPSPTLPRARRR